MLRNVLSHLNRVIVFFQKKYYTCLVKIKVGRYTPPLFVGGKTLLTQNTHLGKNTNFNGMSVYGNGKVYIGDNFHSGQECMLITDVHDYDYGDAIPYGATYMRRQIIIKDNVWIGSRVTVLGGVTIEEGAIIQAASVVVSDIPRYGIAGGNPAKVFKYRNAEHYEKLKNQKQFH